MDVQAPGKTKMLWGASLLLVSAFCTELNIGVGAVMGLGVIAKYAGINGLFAAMPRVLMLMIVPAFYLVVSILGLTRAKKPEKCKPCKVLGIIVLILAIVSACYSLSKGFSAYLLGRLVGSALWPGLYCMGASENWSYAKKQQEQAEERARREAAGLPPRPFPFGGERN